MVRPEIEEQWPKLQDWIMKQRRWLNLPEGKYLIEMWEQYKEQVNG